MHIYSGRSNISSVSVSNSRREDPQLDAYEPISLVTNEEQTLSDPPVWYESYVKRSSDIPKTLKTIKRDSKLLVSQFLPSFSVTNIRSIRSKIFS